MADENTTLFSDERLSDLIDTRRREAAQAASRVPESELRAQRPADLAAKLAGRYMIQVPRLREDRITVGRPQEVQVDVSQDPSRMVFDRSRPAYLTGTRIAYRVPFVGDGLLFRYRPSQYTFNPPRASVGHDELLFIYDRVNPDAAALQQEFERERASVQEWLSWAASDAEGFNNGLVPGLQQAIESRLARLRENDDLGGKLGYPIE